MTEVRECCQDCLKDLCSWRPNLLPCRWLSSHGYSLAAPASSLQFVQQDAGKAGRKKEREREAPKSEKQTFTTGKSTNPNIQTQIVTFVTWPGHCCISTRGCKVFYIGPITVNSKINVLEEDNGCIRKLARAASPVSFLWAEANKATKAYGNKGAWHGKQCLQQGETWKVKAWQG